MFSLSSPNLGGISPGILPNFCLKLTTMRTSDRTVRFHGLVPTVTEDRLNEMAATLCTRRSTSLSLSSVGRWLGLQQQNENPENARPAILGTSLVRLEQEPGGFQTATVTYGSETKKQRATGSFKPTAECAKVDDDFEGVTVLYGGDGGSVDVEYVNPCPPLPAR